MGLQLIVNQDATHSYSSPQNTSPPKFLLPRLATFRIPPSGAGGPAFSEPCVGRLNLSRVVRQSDATPRPGSIPRAAKFPAASCLYASPDVASREGTVVKWYKVLRPGRRMMFGCVLRR